MMKRNKVIITVTLFICSIVIYLLFSNVKYRSENHNRIVNTTETTASQSILIPKPDKRDLRLQRMRLREGFKNMDFESHVPKKQSMDEYLEAIGYDKEEWQERTRIMKESDPYYWERATKTLESMLNSQENDFRWTDEIATQVSETLDLEDSEGTELSNVDCRQSLCKITLHHKDIDSHDDYYQGPYLQGEWVGKSSHSHGERVPQEDGSLVSTVYFSKKDNGEAFLEMRKKILADVNEESVKLVQTEAKDNIERRN